MQQQQRPSRSIRQPSVPNRSVRIFIGMDRLATEEEVRDVTAAIVDAGAPVVSVSAETGGKYGFYLVIKFEDGWSDIEKQFDIAASLQMQLGGSSEEKDKFYT